MMQVQSASSRLSKSDLDIWPQETVFLLEGQNTLPRHFREMFDPGNFAVLTYTSDLEFMSADQPDRTGCILLDSSIGAPTCLSLLQRLRPNAHRSAAILLANTADIRLAVDAMKGGAFNVLEKPLNESEVKFSVHEALLSLRPPDRSLRSFAPTISRETAQAACASLTGRQRQILTCILNGQPNKNIAADLGISQRTAENHRAAIMKRMGASSLSHLLQIALAASYRT